MDPQSFLANLGEQASHMRTVECTNAIEQSLRSMFCTEAPAGHPLTDFEFEEFAVGETAHGCMIDSKESGSGTHKT